MKFILIILSLSLSTYISAQNFVANTLELKSIFEPEVEIRGEDFLRLNNGNYAMLSSVFPDCTNRDSMVWKYSLFNEDMQLLFESDSHDLNWSYTAGMIAPYQDDQFVAIISSEVNDTLSFALIKEDLSEIELVTNINEKTNIDPVNELTIIDDVQLIEDKIHLLVHSFLGFREPTTLAVYDLNTLELKIESTNFDPFSNDPLPLGYGEFLEDGSLVEINRNEVTRFNEELEQVSHTELSDNFTLHKGLYAENHIYTIGTFKVENEMLRKAVIVKLDENGRWADQKGYAEEIDSNQYEYYNYNQITCFDNKYIIAFGTARDSIYVPENHKGLIHIFDLDLNRIDHDLDLDDDIQHFGKLLKYGNTAGILAYPARPQRTYCEGNRIYEILYDRSSNIENAKPIKSQTLILPNPAIDQISFDTDYEINNIEIRSISGKLVLESNNNSSINITQLATGVYIAKLTSEEGVELLKFIKE